MVNVTGVGEGWGKGGVSKGGQQGEPFLSLNEKEELKQEIMRGVENQNSER